MKYVTVSVRMHNVTMTPLELVNQIQRLVVGDATIYPGKVGQEVALDEDVIVEVIEHSGECTIKTCGREPVPLKKEQE